MVWEMSFEEFQVAIIAGVLDIETQRFKQL